MLRMIQQNQPTTSAKANSKNAPLICNKLMIDEAINEIKYLLKSEDWALFALVGILSCDIAIVLMMLAYKNVFSETVSRPLTIACPLLAVFGIFHIFISWYIFMRKKRRLHQHRQENSRKYVQAMIFAEEEAKAKCADNGNFECTEHHVVVQEIKPGILMGKVVTESDKIHQEPTRVCF